MSKPVKIAIGSNYGDEGKGLVTDFLTSTSQSENVLIVRHNGGAQAGHTVTTPDGKRHVFKHVGSGTLAGADTYLSRFFICNPILFAQEQAALKFFNVSPKIYVAAESPITTPYDMMINQIAETARGKNRHGSCGVGFGETIERTEKSTLPLFFKDLFDESFVRTRVSDIQKQWAPARLKALGIETLSEEWLGRLASVNIFERYIEELTRFRNRVLLAPATLLQDTDQVIFEGAQGLLLDQDRGAFPHVTRSNTGIKNAVTLLRESGISAAEVTYITRAYNTRHGAGPLLHELPEKPYEKIVDQTNIYNEYQQGLRFAWLDLDQLASAIKGDLSNASPSTRITYNLAVTCMDQIDEGHHYFLNGSKQISSLEDFLHAAQKATGASSVLCGTGASRTTMEWIRP